MRYAWISGLTALLAAGAVLAAEVRPPGKAQQVCAACHGTDGNSATDQFPRIAGQREAYLVGALRAYRDGRRIDPVMKPQVERLSDEDMGKLAAYYAAQAGLTVKQPTWGNCW
jgi:cytochrome c553